MSKTARMHEAMMGEIEIEIYKSVVGAIRDLAYASVDDSTWWLVRSQTFETASSAISSPVRDSTWQLLWTALQAASREIR